MAKWVDDLITRGTRQATDKFWSDMEKYWKLKSWGYVTETTPRVYCSKKITVTMEDGVRWYSMSQADDIREWLLNIGVNGMIPVQSPMSSRAELYSNESKVTEAEATRFRSIMGSLQYYAKETRYDIATAVNLVAQKSKEPTRGAQKALNRILAYMVGTIDRALTVPRVKGTVWHFYVDSDHAGDRKFGDMRSRTGIILLCNTMPYHWRSNKQTSTARSSAEAETVAVSECAQDVQLRMWVAEEAGLDIQWPAKIRVDNKAAISFQQKTNADSKLKGVFDLRLGWIRQLRDQGKIKTIKVKTDENLADELTKPLPPIVRQKLLSVLKQLREELVRDFRGHVIAQR